MERPGPWRHRYVAAGGARFHLAEAGDEDAPLVLLLHGFPQLWWAWRGPLVALAAAGWRAAAMDLRGYGGSDKTPRGYDPLTLAGDVAGTVKALGARSAVLVGHGWGGYVAWTAAAAHPDQIRALGAVSAPHPLAALRATRLLRAPTSPLGRHLLAAQLPIMPERRLADPAGSAVRAHLQAWSGTASYPSEEEVGVYAAAMRQWPSPHCALEYHRWVVRSRLRADGRAHRRVVRRPVEQPVLVVDGGADPALPRLSSRAWVSGPLTERVLDGVGHFAPEEAPEELSRVLLDWLGALTSCSHRC